MIRFTKMQGLGNDYVYIDCTKMEEEEIAIISKLAKKISDRHFGVGSDGLILICKSDIADFKMTMFNSDGSQSEMCGNGIRCVGKFVYDKGLTTKTELLVETLAGIKKLKLIVEDGVVNSVTVDMGSPILEPKLIPVISNEEIVKNLSIHVIDQDFIFTCVSMGNPHAVAFVKDVDNFDVEKYGSILEVDEHFPKRANIEFVEIVDQTTVKMRVWERGTGKTLACGTGACATVIACTLNNLVKNNEVIKVKLLGGDLDIKWDKSVYMTGNARTVFEGEILEEIIK